MRDWQMVSYSNTILDLHCSLRKPSVTYRYMLYLYLLIPVIIGLFGYCLILLGKYAW